MKRYALFLGFLLIGLVSQAQTKGIQYQAVIQDPSPYQIPGTFIQGQVLQNAKVSIRFTLKTNGSTDFEEIHETQTDDFGLINLTIGQGKKTSGPDFDQLIWHGQNKVLVVAVKIANQNNFFEVSNQTLLYSPYALYADAVEYKNISNAPRDISHFANDVGYLVSTDLKPLEKKISDNQSENLANFLLLKNQQITLETKVDEQRKMLNETVLRMQHLDVRIDQQNNQINQNQTTMMNQLNSLGGSYESLGNKSIATDLGNTNPSNQLYPSQLAVKSYVDQVVSTVAVSGTPDATTLAAGKIRLAGDLSGTASSPSVPALVWKEDVSNKSVSVPSDANSDIKYPSVRAVKTYVDQATQGIALTADLNAKADKLSPIFSGTPSLPSGAIGVLQNSGTNTTQLATTSFVQQELSATSLNYSSKEDLANKSTSTTLGTSNTLYPSQNAVKTYVDNLISSATISDATLTTKGKIRLGGDLAAGNSTADDPIIRDNAISTNKIALAAVTDAKIQSISGSKVTGNIAGESSNVTGTIATTHGGTGTTGTLIGYVKANGLSAMQASINIPVADVTGAELSSNKSNDIILDSSSINKYPSVHAVKTFVDNQMAQGSISDATTQTFGKIKLGGDLAGTGTSAGAPILSNNSVTTAKIADLSVSNAKIVSMEGSKLTGNISGNAANITGILNTSHGGTGAQGTLTGFIFGNGSSAMTSLDSIPVAKIAGAEKRVNRSTATDLGNTNPSDTLYPSQKAVKVYVDLATSGNVGSATQTALNLKENTSNKSTADINNNSSTSFPTQSAVKSYVESKMANQVVSLGNLQPINPDKLLGNFGQSSAVPSEISTSGTGNVARVTAPSISNIILNGSIGGNAILSTANGGLGTASLSSGYVKAGNPFSTVSNIPVADVTGAVRSVNGNTPNASGNVALIFGRTYTGSYNNGNFSPVVLSPNNSDVYIVSGDPTSTNNGRAFIYDGSNWNEITKDQASLDARYVKLSGATMAGNLSFPTGSKIQMSDAATSSTDLTNKGFVENYVSSQATPEASNVVLGKVRLGGDLAGPSSTASSPIITDGAIGNSKLAAGAVTDVKIAGIISGEKGGTGVNNAGKTLTLGGNLTTSGTNALTLNTQAATDITLPTTGTLATLAGTESLSNKTYNGLSLNSGLTGFTIAGGSSSKTLTVTNNATVSGVNSGDQTITLSGDVTGVGTGAIASTLTNTGVVAGVYGGNALIPQITVDTKGRISNVSEISISNTTLAGTGLTDGKILIGNGSNAAVERNLSGDVTMNNAGVTTIGPNKITNGMLAGNIDLSNKVSNVLSIANGGTGVSSLTNNALLIGGTSLGFLVPGTAGYVLSSDGTSWSANALSSLGVAISIGNINSSSNAKGMTLLGGEMRLSPADETNPGLLTTTGQNIAGAKRFMEDLQINEIKIGNGGSLGSNTRVGKNTFTQNINGTNNTALGYASLEANTYGYGNTGLGANSLKLNSTGNNNTSIGYDAGPNSANLSNTIAIGASATVSADNSIQLGNTNITNVNTSGALQAGSIENTPIGRTSANSGSFTGLKTTGTSLSQVVVTDANNQLASSASLAVNLGGTGRMTLPTNGVLIGNGISSINSIVPSANGQVLTWNGTTWTATIPAAMTVGAVGNSSANGLSLTNNVLSLSPADATNPGIITTGAQTFAGAKTFASIINSGNLAVNSLTASKVVFTDTSKILSSIGTVGVDQGGTGLATIPLNGVVIGNGTNAITTIVPTTSGQVLTWNGTSWAATSPTVISAGSVGSSTVNGLTISNHVISLSPADASNPGIVTTSAQTFAGTKTFASITNSGNMTVTGNLSNSALTASKVVFSDASKNLTSTGTVGVAQGGTGANTLSSGALLLGNGTGAITALAPSSEGYVLKVVGNSWILSRPDTDVSDQYFATANQTAFSLTQTPASNSKVKMFINGIRIKADAYPLVGNAITYRPELNDNFNLLAGDRIQFDYAY